MENNVRYVCPECIEDKKANTQINIANKMHSINQVLDIPGVYANVKIAFKEGEVTEHMWVHISKIDMYCQTIIGTLNNDPVDIKGFKDGDLIANISFSDVEEIFVVDTIRQERLI